MKLCWLIPNDRTGGVSSVALSACRQAACCGHEITLLTVISPTEAIEPDCRFKNASLNLDRPARETPSALLQWLTQNPQDILFVNGCEQADAAIPYLPTTLKCVYIVHDTAPRYWLTAIREEDNLEAIVAVSETVACQFRHRLKSPEKLSVIFNGCIFPDRPKSSESRPDDLIFLGGDKPIKGSFDVLELWQQLTQQNFMGKLHWFGEINAKFRAKIDRLPHFDRIHLYDRAPHELIFKTAASAKALLMLSRVEPFGMATIEAMSMGCVPVAWDIDTGTREIVTPNQSGLFAPLGNIAALADRVLQACQNYETLGSAALERSRSHFDATTMWRGYESLIEHLAQCPPPTRSLAGQPPQPYQSPQRRFQQIPAPLRTAIREFVGQHPRLGYWVRDLRGF
jgi:glycosyltransferase involved in cell wall biosynthesis